MITIKNGLHVPLPSLQLTLESKASPVIAVGVYYKNRPHDLDRGYPIYELHVNGKFYSLLSGGMVYHGEKPGLVSFQVYLPEKETVNKDFVGEEFSLVLFALNLDVGNTAVQKSETCVFKLRGEDHDKITPC